MPRQYTTRRERKRLWCAFFLLLALAAFLLWQELSPWEKAPAPNPPAAGLTLRVIDVGQAQSLLLTCGEDAILVDAGEYAAGGRVLAALSRAGVKSLTAAILTHPHGDHYGGMRTMLEKTPAAAFYTAAVPENTALPKPEYNKYEYTMDGDYAKVTKYTGNAKVVVLPAAIDGHQVKYYCTGTFTNKDIELAVFEDFEVYHTLWVQNAVFKDCKKLKKVVFPNHADLGILPNFALGCTALSKIEIDNWQYKMQDGVLYYYNTNSWAAQYYCEGYTATRWNVAEYCTGINCEESLKNNAHIHQLRLNSYVSCPPGYKLPESLQAIYVAEDNKQYFSKDGVLYYGPNTNNPNRLFCYPADKPAVTYTIPENTVFDMGSVKNKHLKTLVIPKSATVYDSTLKYICRGTVFPNLETIKVQKGSPHVDYIRTTFTGKVIVY